MAANQVGCVAAYYYTAAVAVDAGNSVDAGSVADVEHDGDDGGEDVDHVAAVCCVGYLGDGDDTVDAYVVEAGEGVVGGAAHLEDGGLQPLPVASHHSVDDHYDGSSAFWPEVHLGRRLPFLLQTLFG